MFESSVQQLKAVFEIITLSRTQCTKQGALHFVAVFEFSVVHFIHFIETIKYPTCE